MTDTDDSSVQDRTYGALEKQLAEGNFIVEGKIIEQNLSIYILSFYSILLYFILYLNIYVYFSILEKRSINDGIYIEKDYKPSHLKSIKSIE